MFLLPNSLIAKRSVKRYYPLFPKKTMQSELEKKCLTFESRVLSLEQENDSLRLALTIMHQSIPAVPMPPPPPPPSKATGQPPGISFFFLNGQIPRGGDT